MSLMDRFSGLFDRTIGFLAALGAAVIISITLIVCWDVVMRYFFGSGERWALEIVEYGLLWFTLLASAWVLKGEKHVNVDIILLLLNHRKRALLNIITSILASAACLIVVWYGAAVVSDYIQTGERLPTEMGPLKFLPYLIIPVGFAFLFVQFIRRTYAYVQTLRSISK